ncbi:thiamine-phosphate kinase [Persephonella sp.]
MEIKKLGEFKLIDKLTEILTINDPDVIVGFGDDCACVNINGKLTIFTNDIQLEGHHFLRDRISPEDLGWKLVSVNVSDIVACGGVPKWGLISIGLPADTDFGYVEKVYHGINEALEFYKFSVIGGNTTSSEKILLDFFLTGETKRFVSRSDAKEGQYIYLSGHTGLSRAGLELLMMDKKNYEDFELELIKNHVKPKARVDIQPVIERYAECCIDISDGLAGDIGHIEKMSGVKIVIQKDKLPVSEILEKYCKKYGKDPYEYILYGGEDYQLVFTVNHENSKFIQNCFQIGYTEKGSGLFLKDKGREIPIKEKGFEHL